MLIWCAGDPRHGDHDLLTQVPPNPCQAAQFYAINLPSQSRIDSAHLRLFLLGSEAETRPSLRVNVLKLPLRRSGSRSQASSMEPVLVNSVLVNNTEGGQVMLNVTEAVSLLQQHQSDLR